MKKVSDGIYEDQIMDDIKMVVNENTNEIIVRIEGKSPIKYPCEGGVKTSDIERVRKHIESCYRIETDGFHHLEINARTVMSYNPDINLIRISEGQEISIVIPGAERVVDFLTRTQDEYKQLRDKIRENEPV